VPEPDPKAVKRALDQAVRTLGSPEYQEQLTKMAQASIVNSLETIRRFGRLAELDSRSMPQLLERSVEELTRAFLQFNSEQLTLLQRLSTRTLEILDEESRRS
jgi:hypothetical protein